MIRKAILKKILITLIFLGIISYRDDECSNKPLTGVIKSTDVGLAVAISKPKENRYLK